MDVGDLGAEREHGTLPQDKTRPYLLAPKPKQTHLTHTPSPRPGLSLRETEYQGWRNERVSDGELQRSERSKPVAPGRVAPHPPGPLPTTTSARTRPLLFLPDPLAQSVVKVGFAGLRVQQSGMGNHDLGLGPTRCLVHPPVSLGGLTGLPFGLSDRDVFAQASSRWLLRLMSSLTHIPPT
ncbi:hypothetical protein CCHR01_02002 [Colletotrichum chrysophilum]|uniref:Uncharacterized protein n=1 Tax=Colletotrichum chrysophilum TaxID=1836956 RepID=A0AAD9AVT0_9PEZI|nr:hypothetical protein CCHR01_02002 [Colletotrichum chrysophilum]